MNKKISYTEALIQLLNKPVNKSYAKLYRVKAGLPPTGVQFSALSKYDIRRVAQNLSLYRAHLLVKYPELYDTLISLDEASTDLWSEHFICGSISENARDKFNPFGCEIFTLPKGMKDTELVLPKGVYIRFGTNNSLKNLKDFIGIHSKEILNLQTQTFGKQKLPNLKMKKNELRDKVIVTLFNIPMSQLKKQAIEFGLEQNLKEVYQYTAVEAKEKIVILFIEKMFKQKLSKGTIRSIAETNKNLLS
jgi:DNA mismatch repair ATPase MutS